MNVRRTVIWTIQRSDPHERDLQTRASIVAPNCDTAPRTANKFLPFTAVRRNLHGFRFTTEKFNSICFDHCVESECSARLALAPGTMATMYKQWPTDHAIPDRPAGAAPLSRKYLCFCHVQAPSTHKPIVAPPGGKVHLHSAP